MKPKNEAFERAKEVIRKCSTKHGMHASGGQHGYNMVFARDSMISLIGASAADNKGEFKEQFAKTLSVLQRHQSNAGQIPNAVDLWDETRPNQVTFATLDSTLWYLLGLKAYAKAYNSKGLIRKHGKAIRKAFFWLKCQDTGEDGLPEQLPTSDWQDCFPHKYGHAISNVALYYACLLAHGKGKEAKRARSSAMCLFSKEKGYFLPWRWKDHNGIVEKEEWFDSLGNMLAICTGLAGKDETKSILNFVKRRGVDRPFPIRAIYPPIRRGSREWHDYFSNCLAARADWYINGGIWPYIGGFYIAALVKAKQFDKARHELLRLVKANKLGVRHNWEFNEWIHPGKKKANGGPYQAWSAGMFLFAVSALGRKRLPFFE